MIMNSLKSKMVLATLFLTACILLVTAILTLWYFEGQFKEIISDQNFTLLTAQARDIDDKIENVHNMLIAVSTVMPLDILHDPEQSQKWLSNRTGIRSIFDNGIFILSSKGRLIVEDPAIPGRRGMDFSDAEYIRETLSTGKPVVSQPHISEKKHRHPIIVMTAPVFDRSGKIGGILAGSLDLMKENFFSSIGQIKVGKTGYVYLFNNDRMLIMHPDKNRILKKDVPPGANRLFDLAVEGFEGSGETTMSQGVSSLMSIKHLRTRNWILAANYPVREAYAPIRRARAYFLIILGAALVLTVLIIWFTMKRLTSPLLSFAKHVEDLPLLTGDARMVPLKSRDEIGKLAAAFNTMIIELDRQHEALRVSEERYRVFIETSLDGVYFTDKNGLFREINTSGAAILGHSAPGELIGRRANDYWSDELERERFVTELKKNKSVKAFVIHGRKADGSEIYVEATSRIIEDSQGAIVGIEGILRDITERRKITEELKSASEALAITNAAIERERSELSDAIDELSSLIQQVVHEENMQVRFDNPHRKNCHVEMNCSHRDCPCYDRAGVRCWQEKGSYSDAGTKCRYVREFSSCDECPVFRFATSQPVYKIGEQFNNMMHVLAKKSAELKSAQGTILQQDKMASIGQLAAGVAHEINNPMGFIISNLNTLRKYSEKLGQYIDKLSWANGELAKGALPAPVFEQIGAERAALKLDYISDDIGNLIKESLDGAERVKRIVQDLKSFSRVNEAELKAADLNAGLDSAVNILWNELKYKAVVKKEYGNIPLTLCNAGQLNQVFMNLLVNASQAIEKQGEITIRTWKENGSILVSVGDTGCGIPPESINSIFDPFFTTKPVGKGTGLGLSITYDIVKKHNGDISVKSELGKGTIFIVEIPVVHEATPEGAKGGLS